MNTNIVKYILETTDMTQTDIANQLQAKKGKGQTKRQKLLKLLYLNGVGVKNYLKIVLLNYLKLQVFIGS